MPLLTQCDPETENNGIANRHTLLQHLQDPSLSITLEHIFKGSHHNIKLEIFWSQLQQRWSPGFEPLFNYGVNKGLYNAHDSLE